MAEITRRRALRLGAATGVATLLPWSSGGQALAAPPGGSLDPAEVAKYVRPLVIPPAMPRTATLRAGSIDHYVIGVRQFRQQILPPGLPATTVWSYGSQSARGALHYPAFTVEATAARPVRVTWVNGLVDSRGRYLPHLLPIDPTLHWANPPGGVAGRDSRPDFAATPGRYTGPVPFVTHLHGGHTTEEADGYPEAWYLPDARNIPRGYARVGSLYERFESAYADRVGERWDPGSAVFEYDNDQAAATLWYHDHSLGLTRANVYAGPAGFYLLRGGDHDLPPGVLPGPAPQRGDPAGVRYHEIPIAIQDRSFNADGSLFYPDSRAFFDGYAGPFIPDSDVSPIWNPEFFGNTMVANGRSWPDLVVERRRYRLRLLNGCNSRFLILKLATSATVRPAAAALPLWQIGADGGFLTTPMPLEQVLLGPAERADVIVDFSDVPVGSRLYLINEGPDEPFGGGVAGVDFDPADAEATGQVMRFTVADRVGDDTSTPPDQLGTLPVPPALGAANRTRQVSLNEADSETEPDFGPVAAFLGTLSDRSGTSLGWDDPITEEVRVGDVEVWELHNFTEDAHPIHIHEVQFEVVDREPVDGGVARGPDPGESGRKDTVIAYPGEITRVKAHFDRSGLFVWHCHILEHEDNEMMRPYRITE